MNTIASVKLSPHNPKWIIIFKKEKKKILNELGRNNISIEHIGSTAIPNAVTKPEIDIMIGIEKIQDVSQHITALENIGYVYFPKFEKIVPERRYLRKSKGIIPLFHIHMVERESNFWQDHIIFREYLKDHPEEVKKYNNLKRNLILQFSNDRESYSKGKENFIIKILKIAKNKNRYKNL